MGKKTNTENTANNAHYCVKLGKKRRERVANAITTVLVHE